MKFLPITLLLIQFAESLITIEATQASERLQPLKEPKTFSCKKTINPAELEKPDYYFPKQIYLSYSGWRDVDDVHQKKLGNSWYELNKNGQLKISRDFDIKN